MNRVILCEGFDDVVFLGYYLFKTTGYIYDNSLNQISKEMKLPTNRPNNRAEIFTLNGNKILVWGVGGKDSFSDPIKSIVRLNNQFPDERFADIFIVSDRDKEDVESSINKISEIFSVNGYAIDLHNNMVNQYRYVIDDDEYTTNIIPIVIPFSEEGAIETVLMNGFSENPEGKIVVDEANDYIDKIISNTSIINYLKTDRDKVKARFSATISVINPDRSTGKMNDILTSHDWETMDEVNNHFGIIKDIINNN